MLTLLRCVVRQRLVVISVVVLASREDGGLEVVRVRVRPAFTVSLQLR